MPYDATLRLYVCPGQRCFAVDSEPTCACTPAAKQAAAHATPVPTSWEPVGYSDVNSIGMSGRSLAIALERQTQRAAVRARLEARLQHRMGLTRARRSTTGFALVALGGGGEATRQIGPVAL